MKAPRISEIFGPTIQGEGAVAGEPTIFIRTGGCDYRCSWCDTLHAVLPEHAHTWEFMSAEDICTKVAALAQGKRLSVTLSGGNPAMQPLDEVCLRLKRMGFPIILETQGSIIPKWIEHVSLCSVSPKPPSARVKWDEHVFLSFMKAAPKAVLKFVIADDEDFQWARSVARLVPEVPVFLQPCNIDPDAGHNTATMIVAYRLLAEKVLQHEWYSARVLPQLHALAWGGERGR